MEGWKSVRHIVWMVVCGLAMAWLCAGITPITAQAYVSVDGVALIDDGEEHELGGGTYTLVDDDVTNMVLTLNNVTLTSSKSNTIFMNPEYDIVLEGKNTVINNSGPSGGTFGHEHSAITGWCVTIRGTGSLDVYANCDVGIYSSDQLYIQDGATVTVHTYAGTLAGIRNGYSVKGIHEHWQLRIDDGANVTVTGEGLVGVWPSYSFHIDDGATLRTSGTRYGIGNTTDGEGDYSDKGPNVVRDSTVIATGGVAGIMANYLKIAYIEDILTERDWKGQNLTISGNSDVYIYGGLNCAADHANENYLYTEPAGGSQWHIDAGSSPTSIDERVSSSQSWRHYMGQALDAGKWVNEYEFLHIYSGDNIYQSTDVDVTFDVAEYEEARPDAIKVRLLLDGNQAAEQTLTADNGWKVSFDDCYKALADEYSIEVSCDDDSYVLTHTGSLEEGYHITVKDSPSAFQDVPVRVEFAPGVDASQFQGVTAELLINGDMASHITLLPEHDWKAVIPKVMTKYKDQYTVEVDTKFGYTGFVTGDITKGYVITIVLIDTVHPQVEADFSGLTHGADKPSVITVDFYQQGKKIKTLELSDENDYKATLPSCYVQLVDQYTLKASTNDKTYQIGVEGDISKGYTVKVSGGTVENVTPDVTTRFHLGEGVSRPDKINATLYRGDDIVGMVTLEAENGYKATLPTCRKPEADQYRLEASTEDSNYHVRVSGDINKNYTVTVCGGIADLVDANVDVDWSLSDGAARPSSVTVELTKDGDNVGMATLSEDNGWTATFEDCYWNEADDYQLEIVEIDSAYHATVTGDIDSGYTVTISGGKGSDPAAETATSNETRPCDHSYDWEIYKAATETEDGIMRYRCIYCGDVQYEVPTSAYYVFNKNTQKAIQQAAPGATVTVSTPVFISFHKMVKDALIARSDVTLVVDYRYQGKSYEMTIPAGSGETLETLFGDSDYAGFLYLGGAFATVAK